MSTARAWCWSFRRLSAIRAPVSTRARTLPGFTTLVLPAVQVFVGALGDVGWEVVIVGRRDELAERVSGRRAGQRLVRQPSEAPAKQLRLGQPGCLGQLLEQCLIAAIEVDDYLLAHTLGGSSRHIRSIR